MSQGLGKGAPENNWRQHKQSCVSQPGHYWHLCQRVMVDGCLCIVGCPAESLTLHLAFTHKMSVAPLYPVWQPKMSPAVTKCLLRDKILPLPLNHSSRLPGISEDITTRANTSNVNISSEESCWQGVPLTSCDENGTWLLWYSFHTLIKASV